MTLNGLKTHWDVIVIGGGITGAGIFKEAVQMGLSVLLLEQRDYAWGTSSRSSKMVHGGLRYLIAGKLFLARASVKERERLLSEAPGLVEPLKFILPIYKTHGPSKHLMSLGLTVYSLMALKKQHVHLSPDQTIERIPLVNRDNLDAGFCFQDAQVDDARLVLRLINGGCAMGGAALNYTRVCEIKRNRKGQIAAVVAEDTETKKCIELKAKVVINATGAWAEKLHPSPEKGFHLRPLRGSHLIFPGDLYPLDSVLSFFHPADSRPVFLYPWEGRLFLGTTDVDHEDSLNHEAAITRKEAAYLMEGLRFILPGLSISEKACLSSIAGVRPVLSKGNASAAKESREHVVWEDRGLITVTGGKLTTFRILAHDALKAAKHYLPQCSIPRNSSIFSRPLEKGLDHEAGKSLPQDIKQRLYGRYGNQADAIINRHAGDDHAFVPGTYTLWDEISFCAASEQVRHLADLLLRRVRIGILLPGGGKEHFDRIGQICKSVLSWDDDQWNREKEKYVDDWQNYYASPFE